MSRPCEMFWYNFDLESINVAWKSFSLTFERLETQFWSYIGECHCLINLLNLLRGSPIIPSPATGLRLHFSMAKWRESWQYHLARSSSRVQTFDKLNSCRIWSAKPPGHLCWLKEPSCWFLFWLKNNFSITTEMHISESTFYNTYVYCHHLDCYWWRVKQFFHELLITAQPTGNLRMLRLQNCHLPPLSPISLPFSLPPYPRALLTPATQASSYFPSGQVVFLEQD